MKEQKKKTASGIKYGLKTIQKKQNKEIKDSGKEEKTITTA